MKNRGFFVLLILIAAFGCETPYSGFLAPGDIDRYVAESGEDRICLDDGFDSICVQTEKGEKGEKGVEGKSIIGPVGPPGLRGKDGVTTVIHVTQFSFLDVALPKPKAEPFRVVVEALVHPSGSVHPIMSESLYPANVVVHVSHLTDATHIIPVNDSEIWHIAIRDNDDGTVDLYVYPRSLAPNDREYFEGGTELQGTRAGVNALLDTYLVEHSARVASVIGDSFILD